jgi:hypothetical protein
MRRLSGIGVGCGIGLVMLAMAACGGSDDKSTTTTGAPQTIGTCQIQANTSCPGANLAGANLKGVNLSGANLSQGNLTGTDLAGANLSNTNLAGANLTAAVLTGAMLTNTNMAGANLTQANFKGANISGINDTGATQCETVRNDGSVNNSSCPPPSTVTTSKTTSTTAAGTTPLNLPCTGQPGLFLTVYQSQADNFGVAPNVVSATTLVPDQDPACSSDGWATQRLTNPDGAFVAVYTATSGGWQLVSVNGCQGTNIPQKDQAGLC